MPPTRHHELRLPVVDPDTGESWQCAAVLTVPAGASGTLQLLVHGATYDRWYWDPPGLERHSYVRLAADRGLATLAIDRIGFGRSEQPDGADVTLALHKATIVTWADAARTRLAKQRFDRVVGVGHGLGSHVLQAVLDDDADRPATERVLDAALLTGMHNRAPAGADFAGVGPTTIPAADDPELATRNVVGYSCLPADQRRAFYHLPTTSAEVLEQDAVHRDAVAAGELLGLVPRTGLPSRASAPVWLATGAADSLFPVPDADDYRSAEAAFYPDCPALEVLVHDDIGHNINLHEAGPAAMAQWLDRIAAL